MKKFFDNKFIMFIMILFFFKPIAFQYYSNMTIIENIFLFGKIVSAFIMIFYTVINLYPKFKINKFCVTLFVFEFWMFLVTILCKGDVTRSFIDFISVFSLALMVINFYNIDKNKLFITLRSVLLTLVVLQLFSELIWPNGMNADLYFHNSSNHLYFVTLDNGTASLVSLTIIIIELCNLFIKKIKKINLILCWFICILTALLSGSSTALICAMLLLFFINLAKIKNLNFFDKWWVCLLIYFFVLFLIISNNSTLSNVMSILTGKSTFTGRNLLWQKAIELIKVSPILGYGKLDVGYIDVWYGKFSSHNFILEMLLEGGIISFIIWLVILFICFSSLKYNKNIKINRLFIIGILVILIGLSMESQVHSNFLFLILSLLSCQNNNKKISEVGI